MLDLFDKIRPLNIFTIKPRMFAVGALDFLMPPRCFVTGERVDRHGAVHADLWRKLRFVDGTICNHCGVAMADYDDDNFNDALDENQMGTKCGKCMDNPPYYRQARSVLHYDDASRPMILGFKHGDKTYMAKPLAHWLGRAGQAMIADCDIIMPVPLHPYRLFRRRYNQAGLLAQNLARLSGKPVDFFGLNRMRNTKVQGRLSGKQRRKNMQGAFMVSPDAAERLKHKKILLIDDVYTSGATVNECSRILLETGADYVDVLTLAKVM